MQVLRLLKQQIDAELPVNEESFEQIDNSRATLIDREFRLVNSRKNAIEMSKVTGQNISGFSQTSTANISSTTPPQLTPSSSYDPFRRSETNRRGLKNSISNIFRWQKSPSTPGKVFISNDSSIFPFKSWRFNLMDLKKKQQKPIVFFIKIFQIILNKIIHGDNFDIMNFLIIFENNPMISA